MEKYTKQVLEPIVAEAFSLAYVIRALGLKCTGGNYVHIRNRILQYGLDTSHFTGQAHNRGKPSEKRLKPQQVLCRTTHRLRGKYLRSAMLEKGLRHVCAVCGQKPEWNGRPLVLQVDHIDGDPTNNELHNLRFLCPNCHTQTETFGRKVGAGNRTRTCTDKSATLSE